MLTITFTEKAAAELRDRIRARLRELGAPEAARRTEGAFISTIHGFCARVLRVNALAAGLDPQFAVLDRYQSEPLSAAAFEAALEELARARIGSGVVDLIADYTQWSLRAAVLARLRASCARAGQLHPRLPRDRRRPRRRHGRRGRADRGGPRAGRRAGRGRRSEPACARGDRPGEACLIWLGAGEVWPADLGAGHAAAQRRGAEHRRVRALHRGARTLPRALRHRRGAAGTRPAGPAAARPTAATMRRASAPSRAWTSRT